MGGGPAVSVPNAGYMHLITDTRPWYKNRRMISSQLRGVHAYGFSKAFSF
jgi:hypothetical protein